MMKNIGSVLWLLFAWLILVPGVLGTILVRISRANKALVTSMNGLGGMILLGGVGVILHELSHLVMALLFGHHISGVALLRLPRRHDPNDNVLGYVNHSWNDHNIYQRCGNFFIGVAPVLGCTAAMVVLTRLLAPQVYNYCLQLFLPTLAPLPVSDGRGWQFIVWLVLMINIAVGGFDLSGADLQNSLHGVSALFGILLTLAILLAWLSKPLLVGQWLKSHLLIFDWALLVAILLNLILFIVLRALYNHS